LSGFSVGWAILWTERWIVNAFLRLFSIIVQAFRAWY